jgi:hypothetical protein
MPKIVERWLLFKYVGREFTPLSKPFTTKEQAETAMRSDHAAPNRLRSRSPLALHALNPIRPTRSSATSETFFAIRRDILAVE